MYLEDGLTRRMFLRLTGLGTAGIMAGCAANPVTGQSQLMLVSRDQEIAIDRENSPRQFSADYGTTRDADLARYVEETGHRLSRVTQRPDMPYRFRVVNATYINAYAFPGGSIAATRGILLTLDNEAELAALFGHELGHVNARHTAQQMSKGAVTQTIIGGLVSVAGSRGKIYGDIASQIGMIGASALLASYSRDNERQADQLALDYMVKAGYGPDGMVGLMDMLNGMNHNTPSAIEMMFATHPMSDERYRDAVQRVKTAYAGARNQPLYRERYMDHTARLRAIKPAIVAMQTGEAAMQKKQYAEAETHFQRALKTAPDDYAALVLMAKCKLAQQKTAEALAYAEKAKKVYPEEAQGYHLSGFAKIQEKKYAAALADFDTYDRLLPNTPDIEFYKGLSYEGMQQREAAARHYSRYLNAVRQGSQAQHAYQRLVDWGYVKP